MTESASTTGFGSGRGQPTDIERPFRTTVASGPSPPPEKRMPTSVAPGENVPSSFLTRAVSMSTSLLS
ncbi:hypothetical protein OG473_28225 [Streptomyces anulatus]|uniref:hypothetical protein n=1 Tax=Streptomyces anulatus TaxID=1892 RepID=UPI00324FEBFE